MFYRIYSFPPECKRFVSIQSPVQTIAVKPEKKHLFLRLLFCFCSLHLPGYPVAAQRRTSEMTDSFQRRIRSIPAIASSTSVSTSSALSAASTSETFGWVRGCRGVNTVQQSSYGRIDVLKVPIFRA